MGSSLVVNEPMAASDPAEMVGQTPAVVHTAQKLVTITIVAGPAIALAFVVPWLWGHAGNLSDVVIGLVFYLVSGFGITIGFHRLFPHSGFTPCRALKIVLAVFGSMAVEGSVTSWVATQRRHHMFSDHSGDPHSPHRYGDHGTAAGPCLFPCRLAVRIGRIERGTLCTRHAQRPRHAADRPSVSGPGPYIADHPLRDRLRAVGDPLQGSHRPAMGGFGPNGAPPSRHLVGELALPYLRPTFGPDP